ncbi:MULTISPECIES: TRAP transporter small permease [unclassified Halomonas]|uniref:TRAP transporter small permease n=1 Tax=unclassified Halomonas TaxID=2609666 RepID=UPI002888F60C|nr:MULTISPECIES: TRAP transporter small permease [unclassified Halomonas]MDT0499655.1 TRAP transporter small permease [Halomonas sp. PAR7]MDT0510528.1 TRAP transporter small permease [Halomonas sp. LES1]MDT0592673.1 TRAP transporter small permease [Halomonas sp. PAR8]
MPSLAHSLLRPLQWSERALDAVIAPVVFTAMAALIGVITLQILSRVFFTAVGWTEEVARFLLVWITFLAATLAFRRGRHIAVTFVVEALPALPRRLARIAALLVALGFLLALVMIGWEYMQVQSFQKSASLRVSMTWVYAVIPLSAAIMAWYALVDIATLALNGDAASPSDDEEAP